MYSKKLRTCCLDLITSTGNKTVHRVKPAIPPEMAVLNNPISSLLLPIPKIFFKDLFKISLS